MRPILALETPHGPARVALRLAERPLAAVILGHGAGGGIETPDLAAAARAAGDVGCSVALVEQPYRVAGRRSQPPARQLDASWLAVLSQLRSDSLRGTPLVVGGRSAGARVACRTATEAGAIAVICLAFPLHPPGQAGNPAKSRLGELDAVRVPVLVVQGESDPFGMPPATPGRTVVRVPGGHTFRSAAPIEGAIAQWLRKSLA